MTSFSAVPVLLNLSTSLLLPVAPHFDDAPLAWIPCAAEVTATDELPPLPAGMTCCLVAIYAPHRAEDNGVLPGGLPLAAEWLRTTMRRDEWDDAVGIGPALGLQQAREVGHYMLAIAMGNEEAEAIGRKLPMDVRDSAERAARRFRAEYQVLRMN